VHNVAAVNALVDSLAVRLVRVRVRVRARVRVRSTPSRHAAAP
jgi:hypothetical protein